MLHTGATSVPAALTRGDLDIHVRVSAAEFSGARDALARVYACYRTAMWTPDFAAFVDPEASIPTGVALTAQGGEHDHRFVLAWERLRREPQLVEEYNALKLRYERSRDVGSYEAAKSCFFTALLAADPNPPDLPSSDAAEPLL